MNKETLLGYKFTTDLLEKALVDRSFRTLGDSVLSTVIIEHLIKEGLTDPGDITNKKKIMESRQVLDIISKKCHIDSGEKLEGVIGAIYLEEGFETVKSIIEKEIIPIYGSINIEDYEDYVTKVKEIFDKLKIKRPTYKTVEAKSDNRPAFYSTLMIDGGGITGELCNSKDDAENSAARKALPILEKMYESKLSNKRDSD
ncbi:MAG TPA: putative dsRNA-binding protein [Methanofastidiosum sp.]|nr:putative dsRNA-binding protein [Methanofastidiosum sp.]